MVAEVVVVVVVLVVVVVVVAVVLVLVMVAVVVLVLQYSYTRILQYAAITSAVCLFFVDLQTQEATLNCPEVQACCSCGMLPANCAG